MQAMALPDGDLAKDIPLIVLAEAAPGRRPQETDIVESMYKSKIDTWLIVVLACTVAASAYAARQVLLTQPAPAAWLLIPIVGLGVLLPLWTLLDTRYTLTPDTLIIRSGPFRWQIRIADIIRITPTHSPLSSPALSLDRLRIEYRNGRAVMISPRDKAQFIAAIERLRKAI